MTQNDNQSAAQDELALLLDELRSFSANRDAGIHRKCITNLYYAAFHAVRALLFWHGFETKSHEGTQRLFAAHFVKPGVMQRAHLKCLATLESDRLRADYQGFYRFDAQDVADSRGCVAALVRASIDYLSEQDTTVSSSLQPALDDALAHIME